MLTHIQAENEAPPTKYTEKIHIPKCLGRIVKEMLEIGGNVTALKDIEIW